LLFRQGFNAFAHAGLESWSSYLHPQVAGITDVSHYTQPVPGNSGAGWCLRTRTLEEEKKLKANISESQILSRIRITGRNQEPMAHTREAEIGRIAVWGQPRQIVWESPVSQKTRAKWTGGVAQSIECLN
jgi:hypothetical protein